MKFKELIIDDRIPENRFAPKPYQCRCGEYRVHMFYKRNRSTCKRCHVKKSGVRNKEYRKLPHVIVHKKQYNLKNIFRTRFFSAKHRAKQYNVDIDITEEWLKDQLFRQNNKCYYTGIDFDNNDYNYSMSVERIDPNKGYLKTNVVLICTCVNYMKTNLPKEVFCHLVELLYRNLHKIQKLK